VDPDQRRPIVRAANPGFVDDEGAGRVRSGNALEFASLRWADFRAGWRRRASAAPTHRASG
jgi:hypothetical protein